MSTLHRDRGRADADTSKGLLRKPHDYSNQPGEDELAQQREDAAAPEARQRGDAHQAHVGVSPREYAHGSGDRNTLGGARDRQGFQGGVQRDAVPDAPLDPAKRPDERSRRRGGGPADAGSARS